MPSLDLSLEIPRVFLHEHHLKKSAKALGSMLFDEWVRAEQHACARAQAGLVISMKDLIGQAAFQWMGPAADDTLAQHELTSIFKDSILTKNVQRSCAAMSIIAMDHLVFQLSNLHGNQSMNSLRKDKLLRLISAAVEPLSLSSSEITLESLTQLSWIQCSDDYIVLSAPLSCSDSLQQVSSILNEKTNPCCPFIFDIQHQRCYLSFDPKAFQIAILASKLVSSRWIESWIAHDAPSLKEWCDLQQLDQSSALARIWMNADQPFGRKGASPVVEFNSWHLNHDPSASSDTPAVDLWLTPTLNHYSYHMALNSALRLLIYSDDSLFQLGLQTLLSLSNKGLSSAITQGIETLISNLPSSDPRLNPLNLALSTLQTSTLKQGTSQENFSSLPKTKSL